MSSKAQSVNDFPFLLVEEGIKKNAASERMREFVNQKMRERVEIEMKYMQLLQDWSDDMVPTSDHLDETGRYLESEIIKRISEGLKREATKLIEARHVTCRHIMAVGGPFSILQGAYLRTANNPLSLDEMQKQFRSMNNRKTVTNREIKYHSEKMELLSHQIEELESQLANRSRITSARRPPTRVGTRKIDDMRSRLSSLRRQLEQENDGKVKALEDMRDLGNSSAKTLDDLDRQLQELETSRIRIIAEQTRVFLHFLLNQQSSSRCDSKTGRSPIASLDAVEGLLNVHWMDVRANAKKAERGETAKLTEMFEVAGPKSRVRKDSLTSRKAGGKKPRSSEYRSELAATRRPAGQDGASSVPAADNTASGPRPTGSFSSSSAGASESSGPSIVMESEPTNVVEKIKQAVLEGVRTSVSNESIETLELPKEVRCEAEMTRKDPNHQFKKLMRLQRPHNPGKKQVPRTKEELARMNDIRVFALCDNDPPKNSNELAFKKGQMIYQERGKNDDGYCYGWVRDHVLSRKHYGYYLSANTYIVTFPNDYLPSEPVNSLTAETDDIE